MNEFDKPHINIGSRIQKRKYQAPRRNMGGGSAPRIRKEHGERLIVEMNTAFEGADAIRSIDERIESADGVYLEVDLRKGANPESVLERKRDKVRLGATKRVEGNQTRVALFVPDDAREVVQSILKEYTNGALDEKDRPPKRDKVEPVEQIRRARLETFWTDTLEALPENPSDEIWWEVWCFKGSEKKLAAVAAKLELTVSEKQYWLTFPETTVIPIRAQRIEMELLLFASSGIAELRNATVNPSFFLEADAKEQLAWSEDLAERIVWPSSRAPAVCLFDTGVNRAHMLIEPSLSSEDMLAVKAEWGTADDEGHGTGMSGLALHGDLLPSLESQNAILLRHRLESVKLLPPSGFPKNDPDSYGSITQSAVSLAEVNKPDRDRTFCMAVTNENVSGARATTWSAAIDQAAVGKMFGDEETAPKRLFVVSAGNIPPEIDVDKIIKPDDAPIEDPAQAWNALTVGGYTNKTQIGETSYLDWSPLVNAGELSPFSRTSVTWTQGRAPFKPDIVMEAGNRGMSPAGTEVLSLDSLSLLTTGSDEGAHPLVPFAATSAAAALAARLAANVSAEYPDLWPETVRALIVHSAEWTPQMLQELNSTRSMIDRYSMLRRFGHGVPNLERAIASASNHLALVAENTILPFRVDKGQKKFGDCHYYKLPWPKAVLEELGEQDVRLKVTLSYFIEPNPGRFASIDAQRYQSFGLRFDLKGRTEAETDFIERVNALERDDPLGSGPKRGENSGWRFGTNSVSAGSLHCDEWVGPAVQLAARDMLCIKPVTGWWRNSTKTARQSGRYALVLTVSAPDLDVDLHTPIKTIVENAVGVEISF